MQQSLFTDLWRKTIIGAMAARNLPDKFLVAFSLAGEQRNLVRAIAEEVERELGSPKVFFDEWFEHYIAGNDADLRLRNIFGESCELVVVCVSEQYGVKPWTQTEHEEIRARLMKARGSPVDHDKLRILPIRVGDGDIEGIPFNTVVPDVRGRSAADIAKLIIDRVRLIVPDLIKGGPLVLEWPEQSPQLQWSIVDHSQVLSAYEQLLTCAAPWRFLPFRGPSELGKSHITRQMLGEALNMSDLACGRFDFKGTTQMDTELRAFLQCLDVPLPPTAPRLNERLSHILYALRLRARPALLIFDTYEAVGEAQDWVLRELLPSLIRDTWLRVVIAGQRVPETVGAVWEKFAAPVINLMPPPPADWFAYAKLHRPELTLKDVEQACFLARNRAPILAQMLGPGN